MFARSTALRVLAGRAYTQHSGNPPTQSAQGTPSAATAGKADVNANVPGLSSRCVRQATELVGPGAGTSAEYKVPEYFCFDRFSYAEAEVEMAKYRCPQPSALKK